MTATGDVGDTSDAKGSRVSAEARGASCSRQWDELGEPAWGTATRAAFWVGLEQPGPWGAKALTQSRLAPELGARLEEAVLGAGGRILLIRAVGDHRQDDGGAPRRVYVAGGATLGSGGESAGMGSAGMASAGGESAGMASAGGASDGGRPWLLRGLVSDPAELLALPWAALAAGEEQAVRAALPKLAPCPSPILFVCTNGKRDQCCAVRGRKVAAYAAGQRGEAVWECTHTGGHRYAPTGVVLPYGAMYARLDGPLAVAALDAAGTGRLPAGLDVARHLRGLAHLDPWAQAADAAVRAATGETSYDGLTLTPADPTGPPPATGRGDPSSTVGEQEERRTYLVSRDPGDPAQPQRVTVTARRHPAPPISCGKPAAEDTMYDVTSG